MYMWRAMEAVRRKTNPHHRGQAPSCKQQFNGFEHWIKSLRTNLLLVFTRSTHCGTFILPDVMLQSENWSKMMHRVFHDKEEIGKKPTL